MDGKTVIGPTRDIQEMRGAIWVKFRLAIFYRLG
jgi:hypothetical protein